MMISISAPSVYCRYLARLRSQYFPMRKPVELSLRRTPKSSNYTNPLTVEDLEVKFGGRWISLALWLECYAIDHQDGYFTQIDWQRSIGGQTFRFLDPPSEIRTMIFEKIVGRYIWPRRSAQNFNMVCGFHVETTRPRGGHYGHRIKFGQYWHDPTGVRLPQARAMLLVSRQVR